MKATSLVALASLGFACCAGDCTPRQDIHAPQVRNDEWHDQSTTVELDALAPSLVADCTFLKASYPTTIEWPDEFWIPVGARKLQDTWPTEAPEPKCQVFRMRLKGTRTVAYLSDRKLSLFQMRSGTLSERRASTVRRSVPPFVPVWKGPYVVSGTVRITKAGILREGCRDLALSHGNDEFHASLCSGLVPLDLAAGDVFAAEPAPFGFVWTRAPGAREGLRLAVVQGGTSATVEGLTATLQSPQGDVREAECSAMGRPQSLVVVRGTQSLALEVGQTVALGTGDDTRVTHHVHLAAGWYRIAGEATCPERTAQTSAFLVAATTPKEVPIAR